MSSNMNTPIVDVILNFKNGQTKEYDCLLAAISDPDLSSSTLTKILKGLKECVSKLGQDCEYLIGVLLRLDWISKEPGVVVEYQTFVLNLVSAHTYYLKSVMKMLVVKMVPKVEAEKGQDAVIDDTQRQKDNRAFLHVHSLLQSICKLVPMAPTVLFPVLTDCYPFYIKDPYIHGCYARNLLQITKYLPDLRRKILGLLVEKMLELDARAPRQDIQDAEDDDDDEEEDMMTDQFEEDIFHMDEIVMPKTLPVETLRKPMLHMEANRLDITMSIVLKYIESVCHENEQLDWEATKKIYKELLGVFDTMMLPTHSSCHVQFIMFYVCSFRLPLVEGFVDYLWKKVQNPNTSQVFRQAAVAYLASFIARANYVTLRVVMATLEVMCNWIHLYIKNSTFSSSQIDVVHHGAFYSVCQAVFYIFIFRHKEILEHPKGFQFTQGLNFTSITTCRLNPLKFCLPVVVTTFASITRQHQIAFCDTILERNRRCTLPVAKITNSGCTTSVIMPLDSFFPFDPYVLKSSMSFIKPLYNEYSGTLVEEDDAEEDDDDFLPMSESLKSDKFSLGKSPSEFLMSSSPGFKHLC